MTGKESLAKAAAPAAVSKGNNEHSHLDLVAVRGGELLQIPSDVSGRARAVQGDWQHVPPSTGTCSKVRYGAGWRDAASIRRLHRPAVFQRQIRGRSARCHFHKAFAQVPFQPREPLLCSIPPWSNKLMARERAGKAHRKVQPLIFKRGMLQFDSPLWGRNFHGPVPHTPMGFSLPAEDFWAAPSRSGCGYRRVRGPAGRDSLQSPLRLPKGPEKSGGW